MNFFVIMLLSTYASIAAEGDCAFNFADFKSPFNSQHHTVKSSSLVVRDEARQTLSQNLELQNGVKIAFKGGGCQHIGFSFTFTNYNENYSGLDELLYLALSLIVETPVRNTDSLKNPLVDALNIHNRKSVKKLDPEYHSLPCGDATCTLDARVSNQIVLSYDFAL